MEICAAVAVYDHGYKKILCLVFNRHVSELFADLDLGQSATQQAVVHAFLKNYPKAIMALDNALRVTPNPPLYILLGKTQMKAKQWTDAIESFTQALHALVSYYSLCVCCTYQKA